MAGATVGALRFVLGADSAELERALDKAGTGLRRVAAVGAAVGTVIATALVGAFSSLANAIKGAIDEADKLSKLSQQLGISTERLSELSHVANLSGVSLDALAQSTVRLARNMSEAAANSASQLAVTFRTIGVAVTDANGQLRSTEAVLLDLANKFQGWTDGAEKAAIATAIFGRAGAQLIPFLNQGAAGINALSEEFRRLGGTITTDVGKQAEEFNDTLTKLKAAFDGFVRQLLPTLLPLLQEAANMFRRWTQESFALKAAIAVLDIVFRAILAVIATVNSIIEDAVIWIRAFGRAIMALKSIASGELPDFASIFRQAMEESRANALRLQETMQRLAGLASELSSGFGKLGEAVATVAPPVIASTTAIADAVRRWRDEQRMLLDDIVQAPWETAATKLDAISSALQRGVINWRTYGQMVRRVEEENRNHILSTASLLASTITTVFSKNKTAAIASAIVNTAVGITRALQLPPPFSWIQAGLIAAAGAAQIATIKSTNMGSGGGAPSVSGGGSAGSDQGGGPPQTLMVQGINPNQMFSGEFMRDFAEKLLQFQADGGQVILK